MSLKRGLLQATSCGLLAMVLGCQTAEKPSSEGASSGGATAVSFKVRPYKDLKLSNGLGVTLIRDESLPLVSVGLLLKVGGAQDPTGKSGLSSMVARLLDKGSAGLSAEELADQLADYSAGFSATVNEDYSWLQMSALSFYEQQLLTHFSQIVTKPSFSAGEVDRYKRRLLASLKGLADDPEGLTEAAYAAFLYEGHPYSRPVAGQMRDVRRIAKKDITKHYLQYYRPSNAHLVVVGQFSEEIVAHLEQGFGQWAAREVPARERVNLPRAKGLKIRLVEKAQLQQTQIRFGHLGIRRNHPDFIPLRVAAAILGGGFTSRLMKEVREKRGLTYSIWSAFDPGWDDGAFTISTFTRNDKVGETVREVLRVVQEFRGKGVTDKEVRDAVNYLKGQFPRALETPEDLGSQLMALRFFGVPDSYLNTYLQELDRVTAADVTRVIQRHIRPDELKVLLHGPRAVSAQLRDVAPVEVKNFSEYL